MTNGSEDYSGDISQSLRTEPSIITPPVLSVKQKIYRVLFFIFAALMLARYFLSGIFLTIYTVIIFGVPFIYLFFNKHFHLFAFDVKDTLQSIMINLLSSVGFVILMLLVGWATSNFSWVILTRISAFVILRVVIVAFFHEILFRYFIQQNMVNYVGNTYIGIIITSFISAVIVSPPIITGIVYFFMGLFIGWVFEKTKDIYGAVLADSLISLFALVMV
ncbi:MAG: CPBP family intramembrane metalloprotease [Nanoarchaeota archaeon]|nr:CPBP family intramembrane metalloprotease [Nanoarchaeota archaeon]